MSRTICAVRKNVADWPVTSRTEERAGGKLRTCGALILRVLGEPRERITARRRGRSRRGVLVVREPLVVRVLLVEVGLLRGRRYVHELALLRLLQRRHGRRQLTAAAAPVGLARQGEGRLEVPRCRGQGRSSVVEARRRRGVLELVVVV